MLLYIILTFSLYITGSGVNKRHVSNSAEPVDLDPPNYNINSWVKQLHLQHCVLVEIGDQFCALFVEFERNPGDFVNYFIGLCDIDTLVKWTFCSAMLEKERPDKCRFKESDAYEARVHRRLCDFTIMTTYTERCQCSGYVSGEKLFEVTGFPTCFRSTLPNSLCGGNNVCGFASCSTETVAYHIVTAKCSQKCIGQDRFCQYPLKESTLAAKISSFWTDWTDPICIDMPCLTVITEAHCVNRETGCGAIDCLGPGTSCCPAEKQNCKCHVYFEDGAMKIIRTYTTSDIYWQRNNYVEDYDSFDYLDSYKPGAHLRRKYHHRKYNKRNVRKRNNSDLLLQNKSNEHLRNVIKKTKLPSTHLKPIVKSKFDVSKNVNRSIPAEYKTNIKNRIENIKKEKNKLNFIVQSRKYNTNSEKVKSKYNDGKHKYAYFPIFLNLKVNEHHALKKRPKRYIENFENKIHLNKRSKIIYNLITNRRFIRNDDEDFEDDTEDANDDNESEEDVVLEEDNAYYFTTERSLEKDEMEQEQIDNYRNDTLERALKNEFTEDKSQKVSSCSCRKYFCFSFIVYICSIQIYLTLL